MGLLIGNSLTQCSAGLEPGTCRHQGRLYGQRFFIAQRWPGSPFLSPSPGSFLVPGALSAFILPSLAEESTYEVWVEARGANYFYFHRYRGGVGVSPCVFINIVVGVVRDIFSTCVFINIARLAIVFIFPPLTPPGLTVSSK